MKELVEKIKSFGHWKINIRPLKFEEHRIFKLSDCKKIVTDSRVKLRGWDYPHIDNQGIVSGGDWVESFSDWERHCEYWRFFQSAQFIHFLSCREDLQKDLRKQIYYVNESAESFLSIISTVYSVTEIFLFSKRLAEKELFNDGLNISITLSKMKNRQLFFYDPGRTFFDECLCKVDSFELKKDFSNQEVITNFDNFAIDFIVSIFERFNMDHPPIELFKNEQRKFLEGKI